MWLVVFVIMTFVFPFAGARGGFFHSSAAFQPLFWAVTPVGLTGFVEWGQKIRNWDPNKPKRVFGIAIVAMAALISGFIFFQRVIGFEMEYPLWENTNRHYGQIELVLQNSRAHPSDVVMVKNPPDYYLESSRKAIVIPDGDVDTLLTAASQFNARYIILEVDHSEELDDLYNAPSNPPDNLIFLQTIEDTQIYKIK
jgi:hypothetical protein